MLTEAMPLPLLRPELRLTEAPTAAGPGGQWRLDDPVRQRSYLLAAGDVQLLALWPLGRVEALREAWLKTQAQGTDLQFSTRLETLIDFLRQHQLLLAEPGREARELAARATAAARTGAGSWVRRWMGWQLPLLRPQAFLERSLPYVRGLWAAPALVLWAATTLAGLYLVSRQWDSFIGSFADFAQPAGWLGYVLALVALKFIHELGHAYATAHHGCAVPTMGVCVAYGMPMLYTDTSDAARLPRRADRMWIGGAGMLAESMVAGLCTLGWALLPDGIGRDVCFVVATSSWITTLVVNLNPLGRFDGYYMLSDALRFPNLQQRALAHAGHGLERVLFGRHGPGPENLRGWQSVVLSAYGTGVWLFRLSIGLGIAALLYGLLFQAAAVVAATATLWWAVCAPLGPRLSTWWLQRGLVSGQRWLGLGLVLVGLLGLVFAPLDRSVRAPGLMGWQQEQVLFAAEVAQVDEVLVRDGQRVVADQPLLRLSSSELRRKIAEAEIQRIVTLERIDRIAADARDLSELQVLEQQKAEAVATVNGLRERERQLLVRAEGAGQMADLPPGLEAGRWVRSDQPLGRVLIGSERDVLAYVDDAAMQRLRNGALAEFVPDDLTLPRTVLTLTAIDASAAEQVTPDFLASVHGGSLPTVLGRDGQAVPRQALHRVRFELRAGQMPPSGRRLLRGEVRIDAEAQSLAEQAGRRLLGIVLRELE